MQNAYSNKWIIYVWLVLKIHIQASNQTLLWDPSKDCWLEQIKRKLWWMNFISIYSGWERIHIDTFSLSRAEPTKRWWTWVTYGATSRTLYNKWSLFTCIQMTWWLGKRINCCCSQSYNGARNQVGYKIRIMDGVNGVTLHIPKTDGNLYQMNNQ